jgi:tetratricopeptide (TPR) repeat protein
VLFSIGAALNRDGAEDIVSLYLQIAKALDPESADILVMLGGIAENLNQPDRAIALYKSVPDNSPMRRIVRNAARPGARLEGGKVDEARKHLKELIELRPEGYPQLPRLWQRAVRCQGLCKAMAENYDKAVEVIGPLPGAATGRCSSSAALPMSAEEWDKAEPSFKKALDLNPDQPQVLNYLGYSWVDMNINLDEGLGMIRKAVDLKPDDGYIVDSLGWAYFRMGRFDDAAERTGARRRAQGRRRDDQRPSGRCLLARRPQAGSGLPVEPGAWL